MAFRWALAGSGSRGTYMYAKPLATEPKYKGKAELVGLFDVSPTRMDYCRQTIGRPDIPAYTDFDRMMEELNPDGVIICTTDSTHAEFIVRTLKRHKDAITEKPLCTTSEQVRRILAAQNKSHGRVMVTHNMRYGPAESALKKAIAAGLIGQVRFMEFRELLDRRHGADYFRRWHRIKQNSGGLLIQKGSHHFDLLNYYNGGAKPVEIAARGGLNLYGKAGPYRGERCRGCAHASECEFFADMSGDEHTVKLYFQAEADSGYVRDACVFGNDIDIEDTITAGFEYDNGVRVGYSLCAYASIEGHHIVVQGTAGRLELTSRHQTWGHGSFAVYGLEKVGSTLELFSHKDGYKILPIEDVEGGHGGADPRLREDFFLRDRNAPRKPEMASLDEAVQAVLIGIAANISMEKGGKVVKIQSLIK